MRRPATPTAAASPRPRLFDRRGLRAGRTCSASPASCAGSTARRQTVPCVSTPPANAYWGLYWSNGTSGSWSYSSLGVGSLTVPAGGSVAFAWQGGPRVRPASPPPLPGRSPLADQPHPEPDAVRPASPSSTQPHQRRRSRRPSRPTTQATASPTPGGTGGSPPVADPEPSGVAHGRRPDSPSAADPHRRPAPRRRGRPVDDVVGGRVGVRDARRRTGPPTTRRRESPTHAARTPSRPRRPRPTASTDAPDQGGSGSVPLPLVLAVMALLGAAVAGTVVVAQAPPDVSRLPRDLHPVAWWLWALGLAAGASLTTNPLTLLHAHRGRRASWSRPSLRPRLVRLVPALPRPRRWRSW